MQPHDPGGSALQAAVTPQQEGRATPHLSLHDRVSSNGDPVVSANPLVLSAEQQRLAAEFAACGPFQKCDWIRANSREKNIALRRLYPDPRQRAKIVRFARDLSADFIAKGIIPRDFKHDFFGYEMPHPKGPSD